MKKFLSFFLILTLLLSFAACSNNEDAPHEDNNNVVLNDTNKETENNNIFDGGKITIEKVRNAPQTNANDFAIEIVDNGVLLNKYNGNDEIVVIPDKINGIPVTEITEACFANNKELKGVKISDTVEYIYPGVFGNCDNLEIFISGKNVKSIGEHAFLNCRSLNSVELNNGLKLLEMSCFMGTDSLIEIFIPSSTTSLNRPFLASSTNVTIVCEAGSAAEAYAMDSGINYEIK